jgi:hypothetical protein
MQIGASQGKKLLPDRKVHTIGTELGSGRMGEGAIEQHRYLSEELTTSITYVIPTIVSSP